MNFSKFVFFSPYNSSFMLKMLKRISNHFFVCFSESSFVLLFLRKNGITIIEKKNGIDAPMKKDDFRILSA